MSDPERNTRIARQFLDEVWTHGRFDNLDLIVAPHHIHHFTTFDVHGPTGVRELVQHVRTSFPDAVFRVQDSIAGGDRVVLRVHATSTHAESGRGVQYQIIDIFRFEDGRIVERWGEYDTAHLTQQLQASR